MPRSNDSSSQGEPATYKEKDYSERQDVDQMPRVGASTIKPDGPIVTSKSKGVIGMELLMGRLNTKYFVLLYGGFILLAYTLSLGEWWA